MGTSLMIFIIHSRPFQGDNVRQELSELVGELPDLFNEVVSILPPLLPAMNYYEAFRHYSSGKSR